MRRAKSALEEERYKAAVAEVDVSPASCVVEAMIEALGRGDSGYPHAEAGGHLEVLEGRLVVGEDAS